MAISSLADYRAAVKYQMLAVTTGANNTSSTHGSTINNLTISNTANGVVPTGAQGAFVVPTIGAGQKGYLSRMYGWNSNNIAAWPRVYDRLFHAGAYSFNSAVTLTSQPSFASRVPNGDYRGLSIWVEQVTVGTGIQNVVVTYTNENGVTGRTTGTAVAPNNAASAVRDTWRLPLQAGDLGVQKIESVTGSVATAGTFNVLIMREIFTGIFATPIGSNQGSYKVTFEDYGFLEIGTPEIFSDSCLFFLPHKSAGNVSIWGTAEIAIG